MDAVQQIITFATAQQDYVWFLVVLAWLGVSVLLWSTRHEVPVRSSLWLALLAGSGLWQATVELFWHAVPPDAAGRYSPRLAWDLALAAGVAIGVAAVTGEASSRLRRSLRWQLAFSACAVGLLIVRWYAHAFTSAAFALLGAIGGWMLYRQSISGRTGNAGRQWRVGWLCAALLPLFSTIGPLAEATTDMRRHVDLSRWAVPAAIGHMVAALLLAGAWIDARALLPDSVRHTRPWRNLAGALAIWLLIGFVLAILAGRFERLSFERNVLARVRTAAELVDLAAAAACLGPQFRLEGRSFPQQASGRVNPGALVPFLRTGVSQSLQRDLTRVERTNRDALWAHLMTIRDGVLITYAFAERIPNDIDFVPVHRPATESDLLAWAAREPIFDSPSIGGWGETVRARAPLLDRQKRMLGWLALEFGAVDWAASQARARLLTFGIVALGAGMMLLWMLQRLSAQARMHAENAATAAALADQTKTAFLAKVSHELRTPIQSVLGYSELLGTTPQGPLFAQRLTALRQHGEIMLRLVNDLIDLSSFQAGAFRLVPAPVALPALITEGVESLRPRAEAKGLHLSCRLEPGIPRWVQADAIRLRQILNNLVGNAIKYTATGRIDITLTGSMSDRGALCRLVVRDTGPGIPRDAQERIFQPFARLESALPQEGSGLGLALSRALCICQGGGLQVESDGRTGSVFTAEFVFQPCDAPAPVDAPATSPAITRPLAGRRILIAEDNRLVRELFISYLEEHGAICTVATDGRQAVQLALAREFDALVLDLLMPQLDGIEVTRLLRTAGRAPARIVGVSAHADRNEQARAEAVGMDRFLFKPVNLSTLAAALVDGPAVSMPDRFIDRAAIVEKLGLRGQFFREAPDLLEQMSVHLCDGNWSGLRASAHYLKNSADVLDLSEVGRLCSDIETASARRATADAIRLIRRLHQTITTLSAGTPAESSP